MKAERYDLLVLCFCFISIFWYFWQPAGEGTKMTRQLETTQRFFYKFIFIKLIHTYIKINKIVNSYISKF